MLHEWIDSCDVYLVTGYTDMRKGINGLAAIVQGKLFMDPFGKSLYLFCGRSRCKMKGLLWDGDGFLLLYKRLENGSFQWPRDDTEVKKLTAQQTRWLLEGLSIEQSKAIKTAKPGIIY